MNRGNEATKVFPVKGDAASFKSMKLLRNQLRQRGIEAKGKLPQLSIEYYYTNQIGETVPIYRYIGITSITPYDLF